MHLNSNVIGKGGGRSKKEAEQQRLVRLGADGILNTVIFQFSFRTTVVRISAAFVIRKYHRAVVSADKRRCKKYTRNAVNDLGENAKMPRLHFSVAVYGN